MNVLLIAQAYPPFPAVGALRARKVAGALVRAGHRVTVLTQRLPGEVGDARPDDVGARVRTVAVGPRYAARLAGRLRGVRAALGGRRGGAPHAGAPHAGANGAAGAHVAGAVVEGAATASPDVAAAAGRGAVERFVLSLFELPDADQHLVLPFVRAGLALMREERVDLVYTTAPPHSDHLAGLLLKRRTGVAWAAEFRDPWMDQRQRAGVAGPAPVEALHRWLEGACLRAADHVICVTAAARERMARKLPPAQAHKFLLALNGIDALAPPADAPHRAPVRVAYVGSFYHDRDPVPLLDAAARVVRARGLTPADLALDLVGNCRRYGDVDVEALVAARGLAPFVHFRDWVPHAEAQRLVQRADLLVLIALNQPLQVPNKLFDYLGARRPILAWVDEEGESARMLHAAGGHHVIPARAGAAEIARALEAALDRARDGRSAEPVGRADVLEGWLAERQLASLVQALGA